MEKQEKQLLLTVKRRISTLESQAKMVDIEGAEDLAKATDIVTKLKDAGSNIKKIKESVTKPLNEALKNVREMFKPVEEQYTVSEKIIKDKILAYSRKVNEEAAIREQKIAESLEKGTIKQETAERKIESLDRVESTTRGSIGSVQFRKIQRVEIIDESLIPRKYLEVNMTAIRRDALSGVNIPGVKVVDDTIVAGVKN